MGAQSICAHQERNCRLRQVEKIGEARLCDGETKIRPSNNAQMAGYKKHCRRGRTPVKNSSVALE